MRYKIVYKHRWVLVLIFLFLIYISNLILLRLPFIDINFSSFHPEGKGVLSYFLSYSPTFGITMQNYSFQILIVWASGIVMGPRLGFLTLLIFLLVGLLGIPVFAGGGGIDYYKEPTFGYLLSLPLTAYLSGWFYFKNQKLFSAIIPILVTHLFGVLYLLIFKLSLFDVSWFLSYSMIGYDLIFTFILLLFMPFIVFILREMCIRETDEILSASSDYIPKQKPRWHNS